MGASHDIPIAYGRSCQCITKGWRASELANGALAKSLQDAFEPPSTDIMPGVAAVDDADQAELLADMEMTKARLLRMSQQQLALWQVPPLPV